MEDYLSQFNRHDVSQQKALPNAVLVLVLGILSIVGCFCFGAPGIFCGIISIVLANKDVQLYNASPDSYTQNSYSNVKAGRTCAIIGLTLSVVYLIYVIVQIVKHGLHFF